MSLHVDVRARRGAFELALALEAGPGETLALLGPNGSGKSTGVAVLAGLLAPEAGSVTLDERVLDDHARRIHVPAHERPVGVVFQDLRLFPHLSALENVAFPLRARGVRRGDARERAGAWLERLDLAHRAHARPGALSGGEAQRVALARALVAEPRLLLLDEPLSALDARSRAALRPLLRRTLRQFPGVRLLVTHDPVEAMTLADRLVVLEAGRVTQTGTPEALRRAPRTRYAAELVGVNLFRGRLEREDDAGRLRLEGGGELVVAWPEGAGDAAHDVVAVLRPSHVALHVEAPKGGSARNVLPGRISEVAREGGRARVRVDSLPPLVAEVTLESVASLDLAEGRSVWASFKAVEVELVEADD